jgi:hypothetical protein
MKMKMKIIKNHKHLRTILLNGSAGEAITQARDKSNLSPITYTPIAYDACTKGSFHPLIKILQ